MSSRGLKKRKLSGRPRCGVIETENGAPCSNVVMRHSTSGFCCKHFNQILKTSSFWPGWSKMSKDEKRLFLGELRQKSMRPQAESRWEYEGREDELIGDTEQP